MHIGTFGIYSINKSSDVHKLKYTYSTAIELERRDFRALQGYSSATGYLAENPEDHSENSKFNDFSCRFYYLRTL